MSLHGAGRVTVRAAIYQAVRALNQVLVAYNYKTRAADTGAYNCRLNTGGTAWSMHSYAVALDLNWQSNPYSRRLITDMFKYGDGRMPYRICAIRTNNGKQVWNWGGFWNGNKDAMHYEIVCTPADLATGINWNTVYGAGSSVPTPPAQGDWVDMATKEELRAVVREVVREELATSQHTQNTWMKGKFEQAVTEIKTNSDLLRDSLAGLIRSLAQKLGHNI